MRWWPLFFLLAAAGCSSQADPATVCERTFKPYPDLITQRARTPLNAAYLDAMALYNAGDYAGARNGLEPFLRVQRADLTPYIYLTSCHLALGDPYAAELQLDHLAKTSNLYYNDPIEWYRVLCWLCSGQVERARSGAERIAAARAHTYRKEAKQLIEDLPPAAK